MHQRGIGNKTLKNHLTVLNKCLKMAYEWLELPEQLPKIVWPKCASYRTDYLSAEECEQLYLHAEGVVQEMILTALRTGMRQGELKGLQWSDIDWEQRAVTIRHSLDDRHKELGSIKSNRERHVPLDSEVLEALHRRKKASGYVFVDTDGKPLRPQAPRATYSEDMHSGRNA